MLNFYLNSIYNLRIENASKLIGKIKTVPETSDIGYCKTAVVILSPKIRYYRIVVTTLSSQICYYRIVVAILSPNIRYYRIVVATLSSQIRYYRIVVENWMIFEVFLPLWVLARLRRISTIDVLMSGLPAVGVFTNSNIL